VPAALGAAASYGPPRRVGTITAPALAEVSGLTAAATAPGAWWALDDSANPPNLYLVGAGGRLLATVRVRGATNVDWEDLAAASAGGRRHLYVADIGDNDLRRHTLAVYRIPEPRPGASVTAPATVFRFRYPDGPHNAEALFVDPGSGRMFVVTKSDVTAASPSEIFEFPLPLRPRGTVTVQRVDAPIAHEVALLPLVTGAAVSPDGRRLTIRTYLDAYEWRRPPGSPFADLFDADPEHVRLALERQGESIAYTGDGRSLVTTSEQLPAPLWRLRST
jgi:hypothetical protein